MSASTKVMIFIDGSNIFWGLQNYRKNLNQNISIDYGKLVSLLASSRQIRGTNYYCSQPAVPTEGQAKFMDMLRQSGITVVAKKLKLRGTLADGRPRLVEKGVDVALVTDLLSFAWKKAYEDAVLVSGDADYTGAVEKVKSEGLMVDVVAWRDSLSRELKLVASKVTYLDDLVEKVKLGRTITPSQG